MAGRNDSFSGSAFWAGVEGFGGSACSSLGLIVIAALIGPKELGLSAVALAIIQVVQFFPDTLFHDAIIQRKRLTTRHLGSAFWMVTGLSVVLTLGMIALSGVAARVYAEPALAPLLSVLALSSVPVGVASVQAARLRRAMRFRTLAQYALVTRAFGTIAGLGLAAAGAGAWAMVAQYALNQAALAAVMCFMLRWRFIRQYSSSHAWEIGGFGVTRTVAHFFDATRGRIFFAVVGHYLPLSEVGQLNLASRLIDATSSMIATMVMRLYLPYLSRVQDDNAAVQRTLLTANRDTTIFLTPIFVTAALLSSTAVVAVAAPQWAPMATLLPAMCIAGLANLFTVPSTTALLAVGRPAMVAITAASILIMLLTGLFTVVPTTGQTAVLCWAVPQVLGVPIELAVIRMTIRVGLVRQLLSFTPALVIGAVFAALCLTLRRLIGPAASIAAVSTEIAVVSIAYLTLLAATIAVSRRRSARSRNDFAAVENFKELT